MPRTSSSQSKPSKHEASSAPPKMRAQREAKPVVENVYLTEAKRFRAKKRFSQNFLISGPVLDGIVRCLELEPEETVLEIGAGLGFLTEKLLPEARRVVAVELERDMLRALERRFPLAETLEVWPGDVLALDLTTLPEATFKVVGNLPYQITSKVLFKLVGELYETEHPLRSRLSQITLMIQREVAQRIAAEPGSKAYSPLSIAVQQWFEPQLEFEVPPNAFEPKPKVTSQVLTLLPRKEPLMQVEHPHLLWCLVRQAYQQRRKTLRNSLKSFGGLSPEGVTQAFEAAEIDSGLRPEQLKPKQLAWLCNALQAAGASTKTPSIKAARSAKAENASLED